MVTELARCQLDPPLRCKFIKTGSNASSVELGGLASQTNYETLMNELLWKTVFCISCIEYTSLVKERTP